MGESIEVRVAGLFVGQFDQVRSVSADRLEFDYDGIVGDRHYGPTKKVSVRDKPLQKVEGGPRMRNNRQYSALSQEELGEISRILGYTVTPEAIGANIVFTGCPQLTLVEWQSVIFFESGVALRVHRDNWPCRIAGGSVQADYPDELDRLDVKFVAAANGRRGIVGWVEHPGFVHIDEVARIEAMPPVQLPKA